MVDHIRPSGRVGAVFTPTRIRSVKRDRHQQQQDRHDPQSEEESHESEGDVHKTPPAAQDPKPADTESATGQRINVVI